MRHPNTFTSYLHRNIRNRLADLQIRFGIADPARQIIQNEIEATALHWFLRGGGSEEDFEKQFNSMK